MCKLDYLDQLLVDCCEKLVTCSNVISEMPIEVRRANNHRIGKALAELNEIRNEIYKYKPELMPEKWDKPPSEDEYMEMFHNAEKQADEYLLSGNPEKAKEILESFLFIGFCEKTKKLAEAKLKELVTQFRG